MLLSTPSRSIGIVTPASGSRFIASTTITRFVVVANMETSKLITESALASVFVPLTIPLTIPLTFTLTLTLPIPLTVPLTVLLSAAIVGLLLQSVFLAAAVVGLPFESLLLSTAIFGLLVESLLLLPPQLFDLSLYPVFFFSDSPLPGSFVLDRPGGHVSIMCLLACLGVPSCLLPFLVFSQLPRDLTVYLVLAVALFSLPPVLIPLGLQHHLGPYLLFGSCLIFSLLLFFVRLLHLGHPHLVTRPVGDVSVVSLLLLFLALFLLLALSALPLEPGDLILDAGSEFSFLPSCLGRLCLSAEPLCAVRRILSDLELSDPPVDLGLDVLLVAHASCLAPHPFVLLCLSYLLFLYSYLSS